MTTEGANEDEKGSKEDGDGDEDLDSEDEKISDKNSEEEDLTSSNPNPNPKHLPEHLFASTFYPTPEQNKISASRNVFIKKTQRNADHMEPNQKLCTRVSTFTLHIKYIFLAHLSLDLGLCVCCHPNLHDIKFQMSPLI